MTGVPQSSPTPPLPAARPVKSPVLTRRRFLQGTGVAALLVGFYTWRIEPIWCEFVYRDLPIRDLPDTLIGKRLVQMSDLHIGPQVSDDYLISTFQRVAALQPDIVVHTGDLVSYRGAATITQAHRVLQHFPRGRLGTAAVLGNHDYGSNWSDVIAAAGVERALTGAGATVLRNTRVNIGGLELVGLEDFWARRSTLGTAFAQFDLSLPTLVLCHNPDACDLPIWRNYRGWILAGHTHGGQCKPPFLPAPMLPVKNRRYTAGEFALSEDRQLYINRGVGHLLRVRFNARPEITVFRLTRA